MQTFENDTVIFYKINLKTLTSCTCTLCVQSIGAYCFF